MVELLDTTPANYLVRHDDGSVDMVPRSTMNRLLIDHDLWGLLRDGNESVQFENGVGPSVTVIPSGDSTEFTISVANRQPVQLGPDMKPRLIDALMAVYRDEDRDVTPLIDLRDEVLNSRVRPEVADYLLGVPPFLRYTTEGTVSGIRRLQKTDHGWLFHDELLLTWECEFRHPNQETYTRSGNIVDPDVADPAYNVEVTGDVGEHQVHIDGRPYTLTDLEMEFLSKALWAAEVPAP